MFENHLLPDQRLAQRLHVGRIHAESSRYARDRKGFAGHRRRSQHVLLGLAQLGSLPLEHQLQTVGHDRRNRLLEGLDLPHPRELINQADDAQRIARSALMEPCRRFLRDSHFRKTRDQILAHLLGSETHHRRGRVRCGR